MERRADASVDRSVLRLAAYEVLRAVRVDGAYANLALAQVLRDHGLGGRDAGFATELAAGALRGLGLYDAVIDACLDRGKVKPRVRDVLRLGAHQLLAMRVPTHAAVSATVDLARARTGSHSAALVNALGSVVVGLGAATAGFALAGLF